MAGSHRRVSMRATTVRNLRALSRVRNEHAHACGKSFLFVGDVVPFLSKRSSPLCLLSLVASAALPMYTHAQAFSLDVGGRVQLDYSQFDGIYSEDGRTEEAAYFRRAYLELTGVAFSDWDYTFNYDFSHNSGSREDGYIHEASVEYTGLPVVDIKLGRFDPEFGLEKATGSKYVTALERNPGYEMSSWVNSHQNGFVARVAAQPSDWAYASATLARKEGNADGDHVGQVNGRAVFAPRHSSGDVLHFGVNVARRDLDGIRNADVRYRSRLNIRGVDTDGGHDAGSNGRVNEFGGTDDRSSGDWSHEQVWGLEAAWAQGPVSVQGEYLTRRSYADAEGLEGIRGDAWFAQVAYTLTGEAREYKLGRFGQIKPERKRIGAWEVFYRYDHLAVDDPATDEASRTPMVGTARACVHNLGLNWYASDAIRVSGMYVRAKLDNRRNEAGDRRGDGLVVRAQYAF